MMHHAQFGYRSAGKSNVAEHEIHVHTVPCMSYATSKYEQPIDGSLIAFDCNGHAQCYLLSNAMPSARSILNRRANNVLSTVAHDKQVLIPLLEPAQVDMMSRAF